MLRTLRHPLSTFAAGCLLFRVSGRSYGKALIYALLGPVNVIRLINVRHIISERPRQGPHLRTKFICGIHRIPISTAQGSYMMTKPLGSALTGVARYHISQEVLFLSTSGRPSSVQGQLVGVLRKGTFFVTSPFCCRRNACSRSGRSVHKHTI